ncbi:restriction endonuclease subunit S [Parabacteroides distasonis]|uniref:Restriction endonuclease subunit S n=1 Tax=Parabacteroides distasonis TaxID=823 RepID=A0AB35J8R5_PARDI|nr:restriction endonuclease subunit S [Parabacteroides distasonis]MDB9003975.1 restriction endonuclease subunit S [Parabacteroides distasonis]MDB9020585.1 restriction endonuclease subunit S [Parabacteroides distasonis]
MVSVSDLFLLNPKSELEDNMKVGFIPMALVEDGFSGNHFYEERTWKDVKRGYCHFQNGDIGIAKISPCFENRKSTIFKNLPNTYGAGTTELVILRPIKVYTKFYLYLFKSDWYVKEGTKYFKGVVGQQRVHKEIFTDLHIPLPPFAEQQRIVEEIEYWFALIDQIEQDKSDLQTAIRQTKSKILDLAIHGKLVPQNPNDEPASELLKRINPKAEITCDNGHYPQLPDGWCKCRLEDIVEYEQPQAYIVNSTDYDDRYLTPVLTAGKSFVIGYTNETEGIYQNTPCIIFDDFTTDSKLVDFPFKVKSSAMKILKVADDIEIEYVAMFMNITRLIGDTHKRYWISEYSKLCIPIPPKEEQKRIINAANAMFEKLDAIMESL